nr:hypothetical transcript [Hymenolepis microstoma]
MLNFHVACCSFSCWVPCSVSPIHPTNRTIHILEESNNCLVRDNPYQNLFIAVLLYASQVRSWPVLSIVYVVIVSYGGKHDLVVWGMEAA